MGASTVCNVSLGRQKKINLQTTSYQTINFFELLAFCYLGGRLRKERSRWGGLQLTRAQVINLF
jgi:hypothetical protein